MTRALLTVAFIMDVDEDSHYEILSSVDKSIRENLQNVLLAHGSTSADLDEHFEYYGAQIQRQWILSDFLGDA